MARSGLKILLLRAAAAAFPALLLTAIPAGAGVILPEAGGGSKQAEDTQTLYLIILLIAVVVFVGVEGVLLYCLFRYRARKGAVAAQIHGNTQLEIGWTVGAAVILVFIAIFTFATLPSIRNPPNSEEGLSNSAGVSSGIAVAQTEKLPPNGKSLRIAVNGQQYIWRYTYLDGDDNTLNDVFSYEQMVVPAGVTVTLAIRAQDVAHSWWIPKLGGKFDAVPKHTNYTWFRIPSDKAGTTFRGQCAELCGRGHANMIATVKAVTPSEFEAWLEAKKTQIKESNDAAAQQRKQVDAGQNP
jgi:cytochrome c oxidase subunit 2